MISEALKKAIFASVPTSVTMGADNITIKKEYADRMTVPPADADYPFITLNYFADTKDEGASPLNNVFAKELVSAGGGNYDIKSTLGKRKRVTLSLHCQAMHKAVGANRHHRNDIVNQMLRDLEIWAIKDVQAILDAYNAVVIGETVIPKLDFYEGESVAHGVLDLILSYPFTTTKTVTTIETVLYDVSGNEV